MSESGVEAIVSDYFSRLRHALAPMPRSRRNQLLDDLREHVAMARADLADESELSVREILGHLGAPEEIAAEALADSRSTISASGAASQASSSRSPGAWARGAPAGNRGAARLLSGIRPPNGWRFRGGRGIWPR